MRRRTDRPAGLQPPSTLKSRYSPDNLTVFTDQELDRFLGPNYRSLDLEDPLVWDEALDSIAWELLYRVDPHLYERLIQGESVPPSIAEWIPQAADAVDIGAGTGRWTLPLASRCKRVTAVEPAAPLRDILRANIDRARLTNVELVEGFFDALPMDSASADLVTSCSAFTTHDSHGGDPGLKEIERVCVPGGLIVLIAPTELDWFSARGFHHLQFQGDEYVDFGSREEALEICSIFYPWASDAVDAAGRVSYRDLQINPPNNLVWRRL